MITPRLVLSFVSRIALGLALAAGCCSPALAQEQPQPLMPRQALSAFSVRAGLTVEIVAAEPMVMDPVAFDWGPDGRLWVAEMADYPLGVDGKGTPGGRVRVLTDANGDGKYDRSQIFLEGLPYPNGVLPWGRGVLITCAPDVLYAEDTNGDGQADVRRVLYAELPAGNPQHRTNGFWLGLDNWIYLADGSGKVKSTKTGQVVELGNRDLRIRPDEGLVEPIAGRSQFGRARDDWGHWFGCANSDPALQFVLEDRYLRRNPHVVTPDPKVDVPLVPGAAQVYPTSVTAARFNDLNKANRFTSACGITIYRDDLLGEGFRGNTFVCEPVHNLVHREVVTAAGSVYRSQRAAEEQTSEFLASTDAWFRPVMARTGPDGALYVADMYRLVIEHPEWIPKEIQATLNLRAGEDRGRIYRIRPTEKPLRKVPRFDQLDIAGLVQSLETINGPQRDLAHLQLLTRKDPAAPALLKQLLAKSPLPEARLHALCVLDGLGDLDAALLESSLADAHPGVQRHALRLCEPFLQPQAADEGKAQLIAALAKLTADADPHVRLQLACTLGESSDRAAGEALAKLAAAGGDRFLEAGVLSSASPHIELLAAAWLPADAPAPSANLISGLLRTALGSQRQPAITALLGSLASPRGANGRYAAWQLAGLESLLDWLDRRSSSLTKQLVAAPADVRPAWESLGKIFATARKTAADEQAPLADRLAALSLLGRGPDQQAEDVQLLLSFLAPKHGAALQSAAASMLARLRDPQIPPQLMAGWKGFGPQVRAAVLGALLARQDGPDLVLTALEARQMLAADLDAAQRSRLLEHKNDALRARAKTALAGQSAGDRAQVLAQYAGVAKLTGDAARGAELFGKRCGVCHQLQGKGHAIGPDLAALTDKSTAAMLTAVLDPNKAIESKYVNYIAVTVDGLTLSGLLVAESGDSITLLQAEGKQVALVRGDIEELQATGKSLMPEGLEKDLPPQDLADVIAYVQASGPQRKTFPGNTPATVRPEKLRGEFFLLAPQCEIFGETLGFNEREGYVGPWQSPSDLAVWTIETPAAGRYSASLEYACPEAAAGQTVLVEIAGQRFKGTLRGAGGWENYARIDLGVVTLEPGQHRVGVRLDGKPGQPTLRVRSINLRQAK